MHREKLYQLHTETMTDSDLNAGAQTDLNYHCMHIPTCTNVPYANNLLIQLAQTFCIF